MVRFSPANQMQLDRAIELAHQGRRDDAERLVRKVLLDEPENSAAWMVLAQIVNSRREAMACLEKVLQFDPHNIRAANALRDLEGKKPASRAKPQRAGFDWPILALGLVAAGLLVGLIALAINLLGARQPTIAAQPSVASSVPTQTLLPGATFTPTASLTASVTYTPSVSPTPTHTITPRPSITPPPSSTPRPPRTPRPTSTNSPTPGPDAAGVWPTVGPLIPSRPWPTYPGLTFQVSTEYYTVTGNTVEELHKSLYESVLVFDEHDVWAIAKGTISQVVSTRQIPSVGCKLQDVQVSLTVAYTYPRWNPVGDPVPEVLYEWDRFIRHLIKHEEHHGTLFYECSREIIDQLNVLPPEGTCAQLDTTITETLNQIYDECAAKQDAFDEAEGGSSFPLN